MREQQITFRALGANSGQVLSSRAGRPGFRDPVHRRQREALADLRQAWSAGQPAGSEKRPGALARALGFLGNLW